MPIIGIDGGLGLAGYAGSVSSTMLTQSLVLTRDLLLAGKASNILKQETIPFPQGFKDPDSNEAIRREQTNVRIAVALGEALEGLSVTGTFGASASIKAGSELFEIRRPTPKVIERQLALVLNWADLRGERVNEILAQVVPQTSYWTSIAGMQPDRHLYTLELLGVGLQFVTQLVLRVKYFLNAPRPGHLTPMVQAIILAPGHAAYPSGHSTEAHFAAMLLAALADAARSKDRKTCDFDISKLRTGDPGDPQTLRAQLLRLAYRIAENRVVSGVHYPMDSLAGQLLGVVLAQYFLARAGMAGVRVRKGTATMGDEHRHAEPQLDRPINTEAGMVVDEKATVAAAGGPAAVLPWLLTKAIAEWA